MEIINWNDFAKVELRVGTIIEIKDFPQARKQAYQVIIDFGQEIGIKKSSAQITQLYEKEALVGKQIIGVTNFPPKQIGPFMSDCLITGFISGEGSVVLAVPDQKVENGLKLA